jgi:hypothetical protein
LCVEPLAGWRLFKLSDILAHNTHFSFFIFHWFFRQERACGGSEMANEQCQMTNGK